MRPEVTVVIRSNTDDQGLPADDDRFIESNIPVKVATVFYKILRINLQYIFLQYDGQDE